MVGQSRGGGGQSKSHRSSKVGAAHELFPHWLQKNNNTSLFIIISHCFTVRVSNQLAFRVRRAAT